MQSERFLWPHRFIGAFVIRPSPFPVTVPASPAPFDAPIAHSLSPSQSRSSLAQPCERYTGWSPVPTKSLPLLSVTRPTTPRRRPLAVTGLSPRLVQTKSPMASRSIGTSPRAVEIIVPAMKHQAPECCGPRNLDGASAENSLIRLPLASVISPMLRFQDSTSDGGITLSSPLCPSTQVSRASANVGATTAHRVPGAFCASHASHSAPVRVLPQPRPERMIHVAQSRSVGGS